jgi:predicted small secreted protein
MKKLLANILVISLFSFLLIGCNNKGKTEDNVPTGIPVEDTIQVLIKMKRIRQSMITS